MMGKKEFIELAKIIKSVREAQYNLFANAGQKEQGEIAKGSITALTQELIEYLKTQNPLFDEERFKEAIK